MEEQYRVEVYLVDFDKDQASELKEILKIYHRDKGKEYLKKVLRRVKGGERVPVYSSNDDTDALRVCQTLKRAGAKLEVDNLKEEEEEF